MARQGVRDMVRISDGRMSGTAYGTVILHSTPEAARGGPIVPVRNGDLIELDIAGRIDLLVTSEELGRRCTETPAYTPATPPRAWRRLYAEHVLQPDTVADLDFL